MHDRMVIGLQGTRLTARERQWLARRPPLGVILFARNIDNPAQVRALLDDVRQCSGTAAWAAIDEEGGRVNRIPWPPFSGRRTGADFARMFEHHVGTAMQAVFQDSLVVGEALRGLGLTHNCAPVLDLFASEGHAIIGERAYGGDRACVTALATACMRGLHEAGIAAVGKHFPGHGRADADSHVDVPHVSAPLAVIREEAEPFARLIGEGLSHIMTAHVIYDDAGKDIATCSRYWLQAVLRGELGFDGRVWSDDLCMKGVGDDVPAAACAARQAGCDVLLVCQPEGVQAMYEAMG